MNKNIDYIGMLMILRHLVRNELITAAEEKKIAAHIAQEIGANIVASF